MKIFYRVIAILFSVVTLQAKIFPQTTATQFSTNQFAKADYTLALDYIKKVNFREGGSPDTLLVAVRLLEKAVKEDPLFVKAYIELCKTYRAFAFAYPDYEKFLERIGPIVPKAKDAILKALEIDSTSAEAYAQLATINSNNEYNWDEAMTNLSKAIKYEPTNGANMAQYGLILTLKGNWNEAQEWIDKANLLSPQERRVLLWTGWFYHWKRDYEKASQYLSQINPPDISSKFYLGLNYLADGKSAEAVIILKSLLPDFEKADGGLKAALAYALLKNGKEDEGKKLLMRSFELKQVVEYRAAAFYVSEKKYKKVIKLLNESFERQSNWMVWLKYDPVWDPIRNKSGFKKLMHKMHFD